MTGSTIFLDTSIIIPYLLRDTKKKEQITAQIDGKRVVTCAIVIYEFRRRVLKDAAYLITLFHRKKTVSAVRDHLVNVLPPQQNRKRTICLNLLDKIIGNLPQDEQQERAVLLLHSLITKSEMLISSIINEIIDEINCACSKQTIIVDEYCKKYNFGKEKCSKFKQECMIAEFLKLNKETVDSLREFLAESNVNLSAEMQKALDFLKQITDNTNDVYQYEPCLKVGDLLIALESRNTKCFYTMNFAESQHYCKFFKQKMILSHPSPEKDDETIIY